MSDQLAQELDYSIVSILLSLLGPSVIIDVGAERGSFIDICVNHHGNTIIGLEPLPRHNQYLRQRFGDNRAVTIYDIAASSQSGQATLHIAHAESGLEHDHFHSLTPLSGVYGISYSASLPVVTVRVEDFADKLGLKSIEFLKIDTEGNDMNVIAGLGRLRPTVIMAEFWKNLPLSSGNCPYTLKEMCAQLAEMGYHNFACCRRNGPSQWIDFNESNTRDGDWGNVFFMTDEFAQVGLRPAIFQLQSLSIRQLADAHSHWLGEAIEKEKIIQSLLSKHK